MKAIKSLIYPVATKGEIQSFYETYKFTSFSLSVGMIYPNPATDKWRLLAIPMGILAGMPAIICVSADVKKLWDERRMVEVCKHIAMSLPFYIGFMKMSLMYYKRREAKKLLDIINHDHEYFNSLPEDYKTNVYKYINSSHNYNLVWKGCVLLIFVVFVGTATVSNIFSQLFMEEPRRYMIYDLNRPGKDPEERFDSPYFEIMYAYTIFISLVYLINYTGYDGLMIAAINHACLRQTLFSLYVKDAMILKGERLKSKMADAIKDQIDVLRLIGLIQSTYNIYLGYMYVVVMLELIICLYLTSEGFHFDIQFNCVTFGTALHIYLHCMLADKLKCACEETAVQIYCCGWEGMYDVSVRKVLPFMIARAQCPVALKAFGLLTYEMDLFVKTMKSAYSVYTLLKTKQL